MTNRRDLDADMPLRPSAFAILAALADGPAPGFVILERANASAPGRSILGPGSLYRLLQELRSADWIRRTDAPPDDEGADDERRTYHELTPAGRAILTAEAARLRQILAAAGLLNG